MSILTFSIGTQAWKITGRVFDISIAVNFNQSQPNHFGAPAATSQPMKSGDFIGDTRQGGSCNASSVLINPHCNGTHTECVGHLTTDRVSIHDHGPTLPLLALLLTVEPEQTDDKQTVITRENIQNLLEPTNKWPVSAVVVRTRPNQIDKQVKQYQGNDGTPYIDVGVAELLVEHNIEHLLVDIPSLDPYHDNGKLAAHRKFFGLPDHASSSTVTSAQASRSFATVTEMIYVPDDVADGLFLLNLQIPAFALDAAPSRPLLYEIENLPVAER